MFYLQVFAVCCFISWGGWRNLSFMDFFFFLFRKRKKSFSQNLTVMVCNLPGTILLYGRQNIGSSGVGPLLKETLLSRLRQRVPNAERQRKEPALPFGSCRDLWLPGCSPPLFSLCSLDEGKAPPVLLQESKVGGRTLPSGWQDPGKQQTEKDNTYIKK